MALNACFSIKFSPTPDHGNPVFTPSLPLQQDTATLRDNGAGGGGLVLPGGREDTNGLVVTGQTVDTGLDENEAELGVLVLAVALKVLADGDSLDCQPR